MTKNNLRKNRKLEHLWHAVRSELVDADFSDIEFVHNCLPEISLSSVNLAVSIAGINLKYPVYINAITGGVEDVTQVNADLAMAAKECGIALSVGSQMAALENAENAKSFAVVREIYPDGIIFANIGAYASPAMAAQAVQMVHANALQIHLNVPQELFMAEGDTDFTGMIRNIEKIVQAVNVPVIVKEVGFGIAREQAAILQEIGVSALDISGKGGTNFIQIELRRAHSTINKDLFTWGIPSAVSILEARAGAPNLDVISSGGINSGLLAAKSLALGASAVAIAGMPVKVLLSEGKDALVERLNTYIKELRIAMVLTGSGSIDALRQVPLVITGKTKEWIKDRNLQGQA